MAAGVGPMTDDLLDGPVLNDERQAALDKAADEWIARRSEPRAEGLREAWADQLSGEHEPHRGNHDGYACGFSAAHCWHCGEPWPCRAERGVTIGPATPPADSGTAEKNRDSSRRMPADLLVRSQEPEAAWKALSDALLPSERVHVEQHRAAIERAVWNAVAGDAAKATYESIRATPPADSGALDLGRHRPVLAMVLQEMYGSAFPNADADDWRSDAEFIYGKLDR
jgi:hypothetical protein